MIRPAILLALALAVAAVGCRPSSQDAAQGGLVDTTASAAGADTVAPLPGTALLHGTVTYRPRIALPEDAEVEVLLQDVPKADAPAVEVASTKFPTGGRQVPFPFALAYEAAKVDAARAYALRARITHAGEILWTSDAPVPVLTRGAPGDSVEIVVTQARR